MNPSSPAARLIAALFGCLALLGCLDQSTELIPIPRDLPDSGVPAAPPRVRKLDGGPSCNLGISPASLDFGNVLVNSTVTDDVTLWNDGGVICNLSDVALAPGTDAYFSLPSSQSQAFSIAPGAQTDVEVTFTAGGDILPYLRLGTLTFESDDPNVPDGAVPLSAYINNNCTAAGQLIYTVDQNGMFSAFHPDTLTFQDIAVLACTDQGEPFSMNVDQNGVAWVLYNDDELFEVDTRTGACSPTSYQPGQQGFSLFGMGSVFNESTGEDTLYIAGFAYTSSPQDLGTISFPDLTVSVVGPLALGSAELAGTGDGELWGFSPAQQAGVATLAQIDPATGNILTSIEYPDLLASGGWAMKFYGGSFWIFIGSSVFAVDRATLTLTTAIPAGSNRDIVGAGVSTCAPVQ